MERKPALETAQKLIQEVAPTCLAAVLAGSVSRGQATATSDLDIIIIDKHTTEATRKSFLYEGWPVELFIHNKTTYKTYFESDAKRARPTLQRMIAEGTPLVDHPFLQLVKEEASLQLMQGPEVWDEHTIRLKRYFLTDALDDFIGCTNRAEGICIANSIADQLHEFILRTNKQWIGSSKWIFRSLKHFNEELAWQYIAALEAYYQEDQKEPLLHLVDEVLTPHGGRLFEGFQLPPR
ncbi:nucleotidyltransferase domain-containing protein [Mangrovibacillus cuniculi]|uniref:Nucleotidyltransferase domain-containing protein n=1 Tax=Mangrovibacillus cuniculi TaxID=2593652 RepID=A0A7S8HGX8_9BACI|nr:nucleotidyltransferase domain-containing protein [Mangrovibacillus cuniculi]QPC47900.1 nucleotidyltransferase domain-containing protein [Mangrovibacillus cuniculi]